MTATARTLSKNEAKIVLDLEWRAQKAITAAEMRSILGASDGYARFVAHRLVQKGWLQRVRPGLFQLVPAERGPEGVSDTNSLTIGPLLVDPYFFSFGTACTHYGFTEQVFAEVYVACRTPKRPVTVRGTRYVFASVPERRFFGFEEVEVLGSKVQMATRERAVLDALDRPRYAGGIREVSPIVGKAASRLSWEKLLGLAGRWDESAGIQRLGYFLDLHHVELPANVRDRLRALIRPGSKVHLGSRAEWGTSGHLVQPWDIIENVPREQLLEKDRERRRKRAFPKRPT
jgi:predicted transcriptional regulator of viral defense system